MDILIININSLEEKALKKEISKINKQYRNEEKIQLHFFPDHVGIHKLMYIFDNLDMTWVEFKNKVEIVHPNKEEIFGIAQEVYENRHREEKKSYIRATIISVSLIAIIIGSIQTFKWFKKEIYTPYITISTIENKIRFLISDYGFQNRLRKNYIKWGIEKEKYWKSLSVERDSEGNITNYMTESAKRFADKNINRDIKELSKAIYKAQIKYKIPHNVIISKICEESNFWKYAESDIPIIRNGKVVDVKHAYGYCQVYLEVWGETIGKENCEDIFNPEVNVYWGGFILRIYLNKNDEDLYKAFYNYNGGTYRVDSNKRISATKESFDYTSRIFNTMGRLSHFEDREAFNVSTNGGK